MHKLRNLGFVSAFEDSYVAFESLSVHCARYRIINVREAVEGACFQKTQSETKEVALSGVAHIELSSNRSLIDLRRTVERLLLGDVPSVELDGILGRAQTVNEV